VTGINTRVSSDGIFAMQGIEPSFASASLPASDTNMSVNQAEYCLKDVILWDVAALDEKRPPLVVEILQANDHKTSTLMSSIVGTVQQSKTTKQNGNTRRRQCRKRIKVEDTGSEPMPPRRKYSYYKPVARKKYSVPLSDEMRKKLTKERIDAMIAASNFARSHRRNPKPPENAPLGAPLGISDAYGFFNRSKYGLRKRATPIRYADRLKRLLNGTIDEDYKPLMTRQEYSLKEGCSLCPDLRFNSKREQANHWYKYHRSFECGHCHQHLSGKVAFSDHCRLQHPGVSTHVVSFDSDV